MDIKLDEIMEKSKSLADLARFIFGKENYTNREKCKKILEENGVDWKTWLDYKKVKPKKYCLYCGKEIINGDSRKKFCNSSCSASYNNHKTCKSYKTKVCLNCGKKLNRIQNHFCCRACHEEFKYKNYIARWKEGKEDGMSGPDSTSNYIRRYYFDKYNCKCQKCGWGVVNEYTGNVPLQIHHVDGDCTNNKEENLELLCPNCHSLTETFKSNNRDSKRVDRRTKYYKKDVEEDIQKPIEEVSRCIVCGKRLDKTQTTYCSNACKKRKQIKNITKDEILTIFKENEKISYEKAAKILNISTTCLASKCEKFGIKTEIQKLRFGA